VLSAPDPEAPFVHPTAIVETGVVLGPGTRVWDAAHIRKGARLGRSVLVGGKAYVAYDVTIGDFVKLNASVYVCARVTIEDFVMVAAHAVFTNERFPRAGDDGLGGLRTSAPTAATLATRVRRGATIGANATIGPGLEIGEFAMVGMGAVVTRDVPPHALVLGNPARVRGFVCVCGPPIALGPAPPTPTEVACAACGRRYRVGPLGAMLLGSES
jgi:acetyltransferase-like isoleucine patch superfamily enzyme